MRTEVYRVPVPKYIPVHDLLYRTCSFSFSVFFFLFFSIIFLFPECGLLRRPLSAWASSPMSGSRPSIPRLASPGPTWHSSPSAPSSSARSTLSLSMTSMLELAWPSSSQVQYPLLVFLTVILLVWSLCHFACFFHCSILLVLSLWLWTMSFCLFFSLCHSSCFSLVAILLVLLTAPFCLYCWLWTVPFCLFWLWTVSFCLFFSLCHSSCFL